MTAPWTCRACVEEEAGCNLPAHLGLWGDPPSADATCATCGDLPSDAIRLRLLLARTAEGLTVREERGAPPLATPGAAALSPREVAEVLRIDRGRTLPKLIEAGLLQPIPWGRGQRFDAAEVAALAKRGGTDLPVGRDPSAAARAARKARAAAPTRPARGRRARRKASTVADAIRAIPI